jgi:hypothetical protein
LKCLIRERRVAGAQNTVGVEVNIELLLERLLHVYFGEDTEALLFQGLRYPADGGFE